MHNFDKIFAPKVSCFIFLTAITLTSKNVYSDSVSYCQKRSPHR